MKYVYQDKYDNCLSACLASVLDKSIEDVPNFYPYANDPEVFWNKVNNWLDQYDYGVTGTGKSSLKDIQKKWKNSGYGLISLLSKFDPNVAHCVVSYNGLIFHDPLRRIDYHPSCLSYKECWYSVIYKKFKKGN